MYIRESTYKKKRLSVDRCVIVDHNLLTLSYLVSIMSNINPSAQELLDLLLDGDPVVWHISREGDDIRVVATMEDGTSRPINVPLASPTSDSDSCV